MIYSKPRNLKYTDLCIWIDENAYKEDVDEVKLFNYLYAILYMLACKNSFFTKNYYYEQFALYAATRVFHRYRNPKQDIIDETTGEPKMAHVKGVLNYCKTILYPAKVDFEQQEYAQLDLSKDDSDIKYVQDFDFRNQLSQSIDELSVSDFVLALEDINNTVRAFLGKIPRKKNSCEWLNIYTSCVLSFLNSITLSNSQIEKLDNLGQRVYARPDLINQVYDKQQENFVILYHLPETMRTYIQVLVNRLKHVIAKDLSVNNNLYLPTNVTLKNMLLSQCEEEE